ncbi:MAG: hypothetical protein LBQ79_00310 [Deltaproteobacteria bacterium]|jgi:hypothetical protein|nr:hypothetical protein [Deltaproteobacteria bacterium]
MANFYKPSGNVPGSSPLIILAALVAGAVLAPLYAAVSLYVPYIYANIVLVFFYGGAVGLAGGAVAKGTLTLNPPVAGLFSVIGGLAGFAVSWTVWLALVINFNGAAFPGFREVLDFLCAPGEWGLLLTEPGVMVDIAKHINGTGLWSIGKSSRSTVSGLPLLGVWIGEVAIFVVAAATVAAASARSPYSAEARAFLRSEGQLPRGAVGPEDPSQLSMVTAGLAQGDLGYLCSPETGLAEKGDTGFFVNFRSHAGSPWGTASVVWNLKKGKKTETAKVVDNVIVTSQTMQAIRQRLG